MSILKTLTVATLTLSQAEAQAVPASAEVRSDAPVKMIQRNDLRALLSQRPSIVRIQPAGFSEEEALTNVVVPGSERLTLDSSEDTIHHILPDRNKPVLVYCEAAAEAGSPNACKICSGTCPTGQNVVKKLQALGYTDVSLYLGKPSDFDA